jgi:iron complex outermembrane receptor protein
MKIATPLLRSVFLCAASWPTMALAQTDPESAAPATEAPADAESQSTISDIIVTATRREARLQDVPVTVTAIGGSDLQGAGVGDVRGLTAIIPAFNGGRNQNVMQPNIRGVGSAGASTGDEGNVAVYIDGVYQADPYSTQLDLVEVERVEVLRGPQGTVFGRNATGGLVNVITPDPSFEARGKLSGRFGRSRESANDFDLRGYATGPLGEKVAADVAVMVRQSDGYISDLPNGGTLGRTRNASVRTKFLLEPSDNARIILMAAYVDSRDQVASQQPFEGNTAGAPFAGVIIPDKPWQAALNGRGRSDYSRTDLALRTQFGLGSVNLETTSGYTATRVNQFVDSDASNIELGFTDLRVRPRVFSQEIRLLSNDGGRFDWIAGAYAFHLTGEQPVLISSRTSPAVAPTRVTFDPRIKTTSFAGFFEGTYELIDDIFLTAGGRFTTEKRKFSQRVNGNPLPFGEVSETFDKFTYRVALRYNFAERANLYASYGTGFKSGVFNSFGTSPNAVAPEAIDAMEIGIKADPLPWLRTNLSVYHYDYKNLQVNARALNGSFVLQNAATAKIYGGELEMTIAPTNDVNIRSAVAYTNAEYDDFPAAQVFLPRPTGGNIVTAADVSGNWMIRTPRYTVNLGGSYSADIGDGRLTASVNVFHSGKVFHDFLNSLRQKSYTLASGEIAWALPGDRVTLTLFGANLTNAKVAQQISPGPLGTYVIYERPRRIGLGLEYRW